MKQQSIGEGRKRALSKALMVVGVLGCVVMGYAQRAQNRRPENPRATVLANAAPPKTIDRGPLPEQERQTPISVTLTLALPGRLEAEKLQQAIYTPGAPDYHHFLTAEQFVARFGPSDADVGKVAAALAEYGLAAERTTATTLKVTGMPADLERAFSTTLHRYEVAAHGHGPGYTFRAPASRPTLPAEISREVAAVIGLDNRPAAYSQVKTLPPAVRPAPPGTKPLRPGKTFGNLTVIDVANQYDVNPLYASGITGSGRTIGIMTLASFTPSDAFAYWAALGLTVNPNRITIVNVDGGPGAPSDASGSDETAIDVEQSGGLAPGANMIVYQAPNTGQGFIDIFAAAIEANQADSLSTSWGIAEPLQAVFNEPITGYGTTDFPTAAHELFLRASIQGQTVFVASGDSGAYYANQNLGCFGPYDPSVPGSCTLTLSVDYPASDPFITAAGGTTLGGHQYYCLNQACTPPHYEIEVPQESVWGWDYLVGVCQALGFDPVSCAFPTGSGGGVSVLFPVPPYQVGLSGIQTSQPGQNLYWQEPGVGLYSYALPAFYAGRNVPDVSLNADPQTGYVIYYTSDQTGFAAEPFWGGTSFVAPQLAGITALWDQYVGKRVGLLNPTLYNLAATGQAYGGSKAPLHQITTGDNWFYSGSKGYNLGAGLGTIDVANLAAILRSQF